MAHRTLIVGAGITGAALARLLQDAKRTLKYAGEVVVWEKNNIAGGRMMARSFRQDRSVHVDMGAQYLTKFTSANDDFRAMLMDASKLTPFDDTRIQQDPKRAPAPEAEHAIAPGDLGFRAMVEYLLSDTNVHVSRDVARFEVLDCARVKVVSTDGQEEIVDNLVLTCPIPNVLSILGQSAFQPTDAQLTALKNVEYSQRIAVAYHFDSSIAEAVRALQWTSKYVSSDEDEIVRYLCWDNLKKDTLTGSYALLVHTGVPFGVKNMDNKDKNDEILASITQSVKKLLPFLPEPTESIVHRWRISQVTKPYKDPTGSTTPSLVLCESPRIIVAGDAFLGSIFDNCLLSAKHAANQLVHDQTIASGL